MATDDRVLRQWLADRGIQPAEGPALMAQAQQAQAEQAREMLTQQPLGSFELLGGEQIRAQQQASQALTDQSGREQAARWAQARRLLGPQPGLAESGLVQIPASGPALTPPERIRAFQDQELARVQGGGNLVQALGSEQVMPGRPPGQGRVAAAEMWPAEPGWQAAQGMRPDLLSSTVTMVSASIRLPWGEAMWEALLAALLTGTAKEREEAAKKLSEIMAAINGGVESDDWATRRDWTAFAESMPFWAILYWLILYASPLQKLEGKERAKKIRSSAWYKYMSDSESLSAAFDRDTYGAQLRHLSDQQLAALKKKLESEHRKVVLQGVRDADIMNDGTQTPQVRAQAEKRLNAANKKRDII